MDFLTLKPESFGLDISDLSLKIIKLKRKKKSLDLVSFGEEIINPGLIKGGEIKDEKKLAEIIKEAIKKVKGEKIRTKYVIASLPEEKAFLQVIQMPRLPEEDLKSAVVYEAENYIPLPIEQVYLDFQIVPPVSNHLDHYDVLIAALPKKTVDPYVACLKKANLEPLALEIESLSIARALVEKETTNSPVLIIDFGATRTGFIIFSGHSLRFTSSIPVSSQKFTEAVSQTMNVDLTKAEKLKIKFGLIGRAVAKGEEEDLSSSPRRAAAKGEEEDLSSSPTEAKPEGGQVFDALIPPLTDLLEQIKKYLDYYQTHTSHEHLPPDGKGVSKILLCGGGANLKELVGFLSQELKLPVEIGNPWANILAKGQKEALGLPFEKSLSFTTALGLALRGVKSQ